MLIGQTENSNNTSYKGNLNILDVSEEKFVADGFGVKRHDLMYNYFVIVGPSKDPASIKQVSKAEVAVKKNFLVYL